jgi:hypothetical protein
MIHQRKKWHILTDDWMTSGTEIIKCYMLATLQSQTLWSVTHFSLFKRMAHTVFQRKQRVRHQNMDIKMPVNCMTLH